MVCCVSAYVCMYHTCILFYSSHLSTYPPTRRHTHTHTHLNPLHQPPNHRLDPGAARQRFVVEQLQHAAAAVDFMLMVVVVRKGDIHERKIVYLCVCEVAIRGGAYTSYAPQSPPFDVCCQRRQPRERQRPTPLLGQEHMQAAGGEVRVSEALLLQAGDGGFVPVLVWGVCVLCVVFRYTDTYKPTYRVQCDRYIHVHTYIHVRTYIHPCMRAHTSTALTPPAARPSLHSAPGDTTTPFPPVPHCSSPQEGTPLLRPHSSGAGRRRPVGRHSGPLNTPPGRWPRAPLCVVWDDGGSG